MESFIICANHEITHDCKEIRFEKRGILQEMHGNTLVRRGFSTFARQNKPDEQGGKRKGIGSTGTAVECCGC